MKCPICKSVPLEQKELVFGLKSYNCNSCSGNWVRYSDYEEWNRTNQFCETTIDSSAEYLPEYDSKKAHLCPDCGIILIKFKVSVNVPFSVDHCGNCNGVWLDKNEWESLTKNKLHHQMNRFFTSPWQKRLREDMTRLRFDEHYRSKFGSEDYERLRSIREWISESRQKDEIIAFLIDEDPYKL